MNKILDLYAGKTYKELIDTVDFSHPKQYNHPDAEVFSRDLLGFYVYLESEIEFITERPTSLTWICTDTRVGLNIIFLIDDDGNEIPIGISEQVARKSDKFYKFFTEDYLNLVYKKLLEMLPKPKFEDMCVSLDDLCVK